MFADELPLGPDEVVFGAALDPGEAPLAELRGRRAVELLDVDGRRRAGAADADGEVAGAARHRHGLGRRADRHRPALDVGARRRDVGLPRRWRRPSDRLRVVLVGGGRMTLVAVGSVAGSPGATRFVLGLAAAWPDPTARRVVVEADPDGGRLGAELGIGVEPGLMALALAVAHAGADGRRPRRRAAPRRSATGTSIPAPPSAEQTTSALVHAGGAARRARGRRPDGPVWLVDAGRLSARSPALPFATAADHVVVVTAGSFPALQLVPHRVDALRAAGCASSRRRRRADVVAGRARSPTSSVPTCVAVLPHVATGRARRSRRDAAPARGGRGGAASRTPPSYLDASPSAREVAAR